MQHRFPFVSLILIIAVFLIVRIQFWSNNETNGYNATSWDAFGYYMYLPGLFIYDDLRELKWVEKIDEKYKVTGGEFYQAIELDSSGYYTNKYLSGVACLQLPYFLIGHGIAHLTDYETDGFSAPYQYSILLGGLMNVFIGLWLLIKTLKPYYSPLTIGFTLLFLGFTSNLIQYSSIDGAMSHSFIFPLYALVLYLTMRWHKNPKRITALLLGAVIGLAVISRPTEIIMIFIPLLWNFSNKEERKKKWQLVHHNRSHVILALVGGLLAMAPQFIYWKYTTGGWIFNVGSKWYFLNPWFRVLVGPEKGWFLYTPVAILMVLGLFFMKRKPFSVSATVFIVLNIWIIIAWSDWTYGASYSTRPLVHSYPVFALPLAALLSRCMDSVQRKSMVVIVLLMFTALNCYQLSLYNKGIGENFSPLVEWNK
ncbi:MAG: glycosyltransferase family 39 protein [Brumimicrobium sp.]|nr:glycosyltransferase family 39 protein [Brumimicrobium sp.]